MKAWHACMLALGLLLGSGCSALGQAACAKQACAALDGDAERLQVWWSPALRDGGGQYSAVARHD